jgi:hypothetical protein
MKMNISSPILTRAESATQSVGCVYGARKVELIYIIGNYWFELAALPSEN